MNTRFWMFLRWRVVSALRIRILAFFFLMPSIIYSAVRLSDASGLPLRIAEGFRIKEAVMPGLCPGINAVTFDSQGRLVVSTPFDIRTLIDSDSDGVYDRFVLFSDAVAVGAINYDFDSLFFFNQGVLLKMTDRNGDGVADVGPQRLMEIKGGESVSGYLKRGPDGWWYLTVGSRSNIDLLRLLESSLITKKNGGALLRISPDFSSVQVYAHGFYQPIGFDFDLSGNIFLSDAGGKNSNFLPWETGSRLVNVKYGWHYGWSATIQGDMVFHPEYYFDNGGSLAQLGVGVPSKPVVYLHKQFPEYFYGGIFLPIWSSGKVLFFPKHRDTGEILPSETFIEPIGNADFAPTDVAVAPDGSLIIATGGAIARATIYRLSFVGTQPRPQEIAEKVSPVLSVLNSPQPFEAWSRAKWMPLAEQSGVQSFGSVIVSELYTTEQRMRAIDVKIEMADGLTFREVRSASRAVSPQVREKLARALICYPVIEVDSILSTFISDPSPEVRLAAMEALHSNARKTKNPLLSVVLQQLNEKERDLVIATARLASALNEEEWKRFLGVTTNGTPNARIVAGMAMAFRKQKQSFNPDLVNLAIQVFSKATDQQMRSDAIRLAIIGLGDYPADILSSKISSAFEPNADSRDIASVFARLMVGLKHGFPSASLVDNIEMSRIFTMLKDREQKTCTYFASMITPQTPINQDFFFLSAYAMLPPPQSAYEPGQIASALVTFLGKLEAFPTITRQQRAEYVDFLISNLLKKEPLLANSLLKNSSFIRQGLPYVAPYFDLNRQQQALNQFIEMYSRGQRLQLTRPLVQWLSGFTNQIVRGIFLQNWTNGLFQDEILVYLSANPQVQDRERFFAGLSSHNPDVVMACLDGLLKLPPDTSPAAQLRVFQLLRWLVQEPEQKPLRERTIKLLTLMGVIPHIQEETVSDRRSIEKIYEPAFVRFANTYPTLAPLLDGNPDTESARLMNLVRFQQLPTGNSRRGLQVFEKRKCSNCHNPIDQFAPDLFKYAQSETVHLFVRDVVYPQFRISRSFNGEIVFLKNGRWILAIPKFIGNDYTFLQTTPTNTIRIPTHEVIGVKKTDISPMPAGLLNNANIQEIADLYKFIKEPAY
ncbi:MAG: hypothetical protein N2487_04660 [Verrucomicrobiae bacterium]|nr:hypothetical protein [Verrucomicrobiae bacterium]